MQLFAVNPHVYMEIAVKPTYIHECELKTRIQEERCIKIKANRQVETNFTPIRHYQENMPQTQHRNKRERAIQSHWMPIENPQRKTTRNSPVESPILLQREIPIAWGYHNRQLDSRNQSFPISKRNQISSIKGSRFVFYSGWLM